MSGDVISYRRFLGIKNKYFGKSSISTPLSIKFNSGPLKEIPSSG
jgi:hypothetical protein